MTTRKISLPVLLFLLAIPGLSLTACSGTSSGGAESGGELFQPLSDPSLEEPVAEEPAEQSFIGLVTADMDSYSIISSRFLEADGQDVGLTAYELIRDFGGPRPIESPDLYEINHPGQAHIFEGLDQDIGDHFVFVIHRDIDRDRDRVTTLDRQRNEIKTYSSSEDAVKGYENETMFFRWKFRINEQMAVSKNFSHFFQLKAVGGLDSQPIISITGNERSTEDGMEIRHSPAVGGSILGRVDWDEVTGEWLEVYCRATFSENGSFRFIVARVSDNQILFDIEENALDLWRGESSDHFVRPKWGIYRSLLDADNLRAEEENVRFANFRVDKAELK